MDEDKSRLLTEEEIKDLLKLRRPPPKQKPGYYRTRGKMYKGLAYLLLFLLVVYGIAGSVIYGVWRLCKWLLTSL